MSDLAAELRTIHDALLSMAQVLGKPDILQPLDSLENSAYEVGKSWSQSWLGYQSRVYYNGLETPPPGAHFSSEWGLKQLHTMGSRGAWREFPQEVVEAAVRERAGNPDLSKAFVASEKARLLFERMRDDMISILRTVQGENDDQFIEKLVEETEKAKAFTESEFIAYFRPSGQFMSRDSIAVRQGFLTPPAYIRSCRSPKHKSSKTRL